MNAAKKIQMLCNSQQFRRVYDQGQRFHTPFFSVFILKNDTDDLRVGITVTRKIGNAVVRNRCKRRLREALRNHKCDVTGLAGFDLVINARAGLAGARFTQIVDELATAIVHLRKLLSKPDS